MDVASHNLIEGHTRDDLQVLSSHGPVHPFHRQPPLSQTLDERESAFSFTLSVTRGLFEVGVGISSIEVVGEVVLAVSVLEIMGVMEADGVTEGPFPMTCIVLFPRLDNGLSFFILIFAYMSLLNLIVISAKGKQLLKKKKKKQVQENQY